MFQELASSPATMQACKSADLWGCLLGHCITQADATQAYTQAKFLRTETWVRLPEDQWPKEWVEQGLRNPVCKLECALYGHPDSGTFWEQRCDEDSGRIFFIDHFTCSTTWDDPRLRTAAGGEKEGAKVM